MKKQLGLFVFALLLACGGNVNAAIFNLYYDDLEDGFLIAGDVVGIGTFSYDGPVAAGSYLLSDLTGVSYESTFTGLTGTTSFTGPPFDPADLSLIAISVTEVGDGEFELLFTGDSAGTGGALDIVDLTGDSILSHEPWSLLDDVIGPALYFADDSSVELDAFGDYLGTTAVLIPEPSSFFLTALGLCSLGMNGLGRRRRKSIALELR